MDEQYNLEFCFKGDRTYVHGTDIYNKIIKNLAQKEVDYINIDFSFHGVVKNNILISSIKPEDEESLKLVYKYVDKEKQKRIFYGVETNEIITCRYKYPEEDIFSVCHIDKEKEQIELSLNTSYSFIENIVAMNKFLLEQLFPDAKGKWYFTRLQLSEIIDENSEYPLRLRLKNNFNFKLTKSEIFLHDKLVGFIYFSLV
jgi:hypothetical protein